MGNGNKVLILQDPDELTVDYTLQSLTNTMVLYLLVGEGSFTDLKTGITTASLQEKGNVFIFCIWL
jgi:hypothetical protein